MKFASQMGNDYTHPMQRANNDYLMLIDQSGHVLFSNDQLNNLLCITGDTLADRLNINTFLSGDEYVVLRKTLAQFHQSNAPSYVNLKLKNGSIHNIMWKIDQLNVDRKMPPKYLLRGKDILEEFQNVHPDSLIEKKAQEGENCKLKFRITQLENLLQREKEIHQLKIAETKLEVQEKERELLGRELHDNVNQILSSVKLYLEHINPKKIEEKVIIKKAHTSVQQAILEIRKLSHQLVPFSLKAHSLIKNMEEVIDNVHSIKTFNIKFTCNNAERIETLNDEKKIALFRVFQEQICNIIKHSEASSIRINLRAEITGVILYIYDDGIGFDLEKAAPGIGLSNIFARMKLFNGSADIASSAGKGCSLTVLMPFN